MSPPIEPVVTLGAAEPLDIAMAAALAPFFDALRALEQGARTRPISVLHLGDSHIASDAFSQGLRRRMQARFGDSGRGWFTPPKSFAWFRLDDLTLSGDEAWRAANSLRERGGVYGVSGVRVEASQSGAQMRAAAAAPMDVARAQLLTGPGRGALSMSFGGSERVVETAAAEDGVEIVSIAGSGPALKIETLDARPVSVLALSLERAQPGLRWQSFGIPGAAVYIAERWDPGLLRADIAEMAPDLVIYGYGGNEGFNDDLTPERYRRAAFNLLDAIAQSAPGAAVLIVGPADAARRDGPGERCGDSGLVTPPALGMVRETLRGIAAERGIGFWDWAAFMGGRCSMLAWAAEDPPRAMADHLHLKAQGYDDSAAGLHEALMRAYAARG